MGWNRIQKKVNKFHFSIEALRKQPQKDNYVKWL